MKQLLILLALLTGLSGHTNNSTLDGLCAANEEIVLQFSLASNKKIVSLCKERQGKYLVYRFGTPTKVELEYPSKLDKSSWKAFTLYGLKRFGGKANAGFGDYTVTFTNNNVKYELFDAWSDEDDSKEIGIRVIVKGKITVLKGNYRTKQGSLLRLDDERTRIPNTADQ